MSTYGPGHSSSSHASPRASSSSMATVKAPPCQNPLYNCSQPCVDGFTFCMDHITEDKSAPYRPCTFVFTNGKRCAINVGKGERRDG